VTSQTPFHALCYPGTGAGCPKKDAGAHMVACFELLRSYSACKDEPLALLTDEDANGLTPLMLATHYKNEALLQHFAAITSPELVANVELPANIAQLTKNEFYGRTPLLEAAFTNGKEIVKAELTNGEDPDAINIQSGRNALQLACCGISDGEMVALILARTTNPIAADHRGRTALHFAATTGRIDTVEVLLSNPVIRDNIGTLDLDRRSALHAVAMAATRTTAEGGQLSQREKVIDMLIANGVDLSLADINGDTALDIAEQRNNPVVATRIRYHAQALAATQEQDAEPQRPRFSP
jgi:ankyrin repeat protein